MHQSKRRRILSIQSPADATDDLTILLEDLDHFLRGLSGAFSKERNMQWNVVNVFEVWADVFDATRQARLNVVWLEVARATVVGVR